MKRLLTALSTIVAVLVLPVGLASAAHASAPLPDHSPKKTIELNLFLDSLVLTGTGPAAALA